MKPFKHQLKSLKHNDTTPIVFDCSDPGTGKTAVRIWAMLKRITKREAKKVLVVAPKTLLVSVWADEFEKLAPMLKLSVAEAKNREQAFAKDAQVYITNTDAVKWLVKQPKGFWKGFDELVVDESDAFRHHTSQRSKALAKIAKNFKFITLMTGTPNSNSITDVWHQALILDRGQRLGPSFYAFRDAVCVPVQNGPSANHIKWEDKEGAEEAVFALLSDIVIRHKLEECTDIPPNHEYVRPYVLSPALRKAYDEMQETCLLQIYGTPLERAKAKVSGRTLAPKTTVTAVHASAMATKLMQIASGAIYQGNGEDGYHVLDADRYEFIADLVHERKHSVVFFLWKHQRDLLAEEFKKRGYTYSVIDGDVKATDRAGIVKAYQAGRFKTILLHPQSAAHGLTLTRGTAAIWASPTSNAAFFNQGSRRVYRISQTQRTETISVVAQDTYEERVYNEILVPKNKRMASLLELFTTV